jgi:anhydro-N-acetylmuramic acid kinase
MKEVYRVTGLMSGSSMDGVDLACCDFIKEGNRWEYRIIEAETFPYDSELLGKLSQACTWGRSDIRELDIELGNYYAGLLNRFHSQKGLSPDIIASHGHTILHDPRQGITLQAGNGRIMSQKTGITVINDFRSEDVAQGGEGAPLVPIGDRILFGKFEGCLNLGGFANISCENSRGERIAFDLCPANMALNSVASLEGVPFDRDGEMARKGRIDKRLLEKLNHLGYYASRYPKSLGREWFLDQFLPLMQESRLSNTDLMSTILEHIAFQISRGINDLHIGSLLITGGGAMNKTLVERITDYTTASMIVPEERLINYKEALIFALLGLLRFRGEINCLASVTGGSRDISAGTIHIFK